MDKNEINEALYPQKRSRKFIRSYSFKNLKKEIDRMYDRLEKTGQDTAVVSKKLTSLKEYRKKV